MELAPAVTCILVNWNGWIDTLACLEALAESTYPDLEVIVVDNGSTDDSVTRIQAAFPGILLMQSGSNLGFAGGNNIAIRHALKGCASYIWLLNNDTKPAPDALDALVAKATRDRRIAAVGSICYYADHPETVQVWAGARVNLWIGYVTNNAVPRDDAWFDYIYGASILLSRLAIEETGMLDEGFFHYFEETELCLRLRQRGYRLAAAPDSRILHKVGASTGGSLKGDRYFTASGLRILRLHSRIPYLAMFVFVFIRLTRRLIRWQPARLRSVLAGMRDYQSSSLVQKTR